MEVKVTETISVWAKRASRDVARELVRSVTKACTFTVGELGRQIAVFKASGKGIRRRTGALARSFEPKVMGDGKTEIRGEALSRLPYAAIHETGGPIDGNPWLTIPVTMEASRTRARNFPRKLQIIPSRQPDTLLLIESGKKKIKVQYVLKQDVVLRAQRYVTKAHRNMIPIVHKIVAEGIEKAMTK